MRVRVVNHLDDLTRDIAQVVPKVAAKLPEIVARNARFGNAVAQRFARESAGPHGKFYWKRLSAESKGDLAWEYGPTGDVVGNAIGAGWRNGPPNMDLEKSQDVVGPKFAKEVGDAAEGAFW